MNFYEGGNWFLFGEEGVGYLYSTLVKSYGQNLYEEVWLRGALEVFTLGCKIDWFIDNACNCKPFEAKVYKYKQISFQLGQVCNWVINICH